MYTTHSLRNSVLDYHDFDSGVSRLKMYDNVSYF